jgi:hypothetical protein
VVSVGGSTRDGGGIGCAGASARDLRLIRQNNAITTSATASSASPPIIKVVLLGSVKKFDMGMSKKQASR